MKLKWLLIAAIIGGQSGITASAQETNSTDIDALKQEVQALEQKVDALEQQQQQAAQNNPPQGRQTAQVQELDQKVRILERQRELDQQAAADAAKTQPKITLDQNGFSFSSANSNFIASLHGIIQLDSRTFLADGGGTAGKDTFLLRRARPIFTGTVFHNFDFNFTPDFGGSGVVIYDAYLNYHYNPSFQIEGGRFKSPVGLEALQTDTWLAFNERSLVTDLVPNRDMGFELHGDLLSGRVSYAAGIFNGTPDYITPPASTQAVDDDKAFEGRLFLQPFKTTSEAYLQGLGFGVGGSYEDDDATAASPNLTTGYKTDGQQTFYSYAAGVYASGRHWRLSPQGYYYYGPFSVMGEYAVSDQQVTKTTTSANIENSAWETTVGWVLTGEDATYNGVTPSHPFDLRSGNWGAWQIVARYADLYIDDKNFATYALAGSASEAKAWAVGLNWYLNRDFRVSTSFSRTTFNTGSTTIPVTAQAENVIFTRVQLAF